MLGKILDVLSEPVPVPFWLVLIAGPVAAIRIFVEVLTWLERLTQWWGG